MPRKQVYGKKRAPLASFAAYAAVLNSSSPLKPEAKDGKADIDDVVHDLENLHIKQDGNHDANKEEGVRRRPKVKDANLPGRQSARRKKDDTSVESSTVDAKAKQVQDVQEAQKSEIREEKRTRKAPSANVKTQAKRTSKPSTKPPLPHIPTETPIGLRNRTLKRAPSPPPSSPAEPVGLPQEPCKEPTHLSPLLALSLADAHRVKPESFSSWSDKLERHFSITKIAEASYGEVYRLSLLHERPDLTTADESVLKIIALRPEEEIRPNQMQTHQWMSQPRAVAEEVRLLARMTSVPGFTNFRDVRVLQGRPGKAVVKAWKEYNEAAKKGDKSIFPDPSKRTSYTEDQHWAVVEMQDAGVDVEKGIALVSTSTSADQGERERARNILRSVWGVWDVFWSVALALAKGEEAAQFEHRDLHLGNICVRSTRGDAQGRGVGGSKVKVGERKIGFTGLETTIIDYTLSRATMVREGQADGVAEDAKAKGKEDVAFFDLATDPAIFEGDGEVEYQYDIYRYMRAILYTDDPLASPSSSDEVFEKVRQSKATWRDYCPKTNVLWLHFVLLKLMETMVESALEEVLEEGENEREARRKEKTLRAALKKMEKKLRLTALRGENALSSAGALVQYAVEQGWLDEQDVIGSEQSFA